MGSPGLDKNNKGFKKPPNKQKSGKNKKSNQKFKVFKKKVSKKDVEDDIIKAIEERYDQVIYYRFLNIKLVILVF